MSRYNLNTIIEENNSFIELTDMTIPTSTKCKPAYLNGNAIFIQENVLTLKKYNSQNGGCSRSSSHKRIFTCITIIFVIAIIAGISIPFGLHLRSSSLLQARLTFVRKILQQVPLLQGNDITLSNSTEQIGRAYIRSVEIPCGSQYLDAVQLVLEELDKILSQDNRTRLILSTEQLLEQGTSLKNSYQILGVRGGHAFGDSLAILRTLHNLGVRVVAPMYKCQMVWANSMLVPSLSEFGQLIIREMNRLGIVIDLTGSDEDTALEILGTSNTPVIYSEASVKKLCNESESIDNSWLSDDILRSIAANGGIVLVSIKNQCQSHLQYPHNVIQHINYIRSVAGIAHVGLGGGGDPSYLLAELVRDRQWGTAAVKQLISGNLMRVLIEIELYSNRKTNPLEQWIDFDELDGNTYCRYPGI